MNTLPTFHGWIIDLKLRELRKVLPNGEIVHLDLYSLEGDEIVGKYIETLDKDSEEFKRVMDIF